MNWNVIGIIIKYLIEMILKLIFITSRHNFMSPFSQLLFDVLSFVLCWCGKGP